MKFDVVTIGAATRDIFLMSPLFKIVRDRKHLEKLGFPAGEAQCFALGGKIEVEKPVLTVGGGAANAAVTFARQGFRAAMFTKVAEDESGRAVLWELARERVRTIARYDRKLTTDFSVILISPGGERTILNYRGASKGLRSGELSLDRFAARWAYLSTGHLNFDAVRSAMRALKRRGTAIAMNPSKHYLDMGRGRLRPLLDMLDVIILNREEAAELTGCAYREEEKIFRKLNNLMQGDKVPTLTVMTESSKGVLVSDGKRIYRAGIFKEKKIVDRTGAGDAFGSGFVAGIMRAEKQRAKGREQRARFAPAAVKFAIRLGSANATSVVEHIGAQPGILTRQAFRRERRFKNLPIREHML